MVATARASQISRVADILNSINEAIGNSNALALIGEDTGGSVPYGLRQGVARTALFMLQEMSAPSAASHHDRLKQKHKDYKASLSDEHENKNISFNKFKKLDREERGAIGKGTPRRGNRKPARRAAAPGTSRGGDPRPPAPPAAGAQAVGGDAPTGARKKADKKAAPFSKAEKDLAARIKPRLTKPKGTEMGHDATYRYKGGKKLPKEAAWKRMVKRVAGGELSPDGTVASRGKPSLPAGRRGRPNYPDSIRRGPFAGTPRGEYVGSTPESGEIDDPERHGGAWDFHQDEKSKDLAALERLRQDRGRAHGKRGDDDFVPASTKAKINKLRRLRMKHPAFRHPGEDGKSGEGRDLSKDVAKGYFHKRDRGEDGEEGETTHEHPKWAGHHTDPDTGELVHSTGKKANADFANATTFGASDDDAMLHTDKSKEGSRGSADDDEFVVKGDTEEDPRNKWFRVSKEGGYASAMASLGKSYHKDKAVRGKVVSKVKSTGFTDATGHQINVKPTGALHNERGACVKRPAVFKNGVKVREGGLTAVGKALKKRNPHEFYRLCKGSHDGPGGTVKGRSEYGTTDGDGAHKPKGFDPQRDDAPKLRKLHKAAELGKGAPPSGAGGRGEKAARPGRRADIEKRVRSTGAEVTKHKWRQRQQGRERAAAMGAASAKRAGKAKFQRRAEAGV